MTESVKRITMIWLVFAFLLAACKPSPQETPTPTIEPDAVYTAAVQTADARLTEQAQVAPTTTPVPPTADPALTAAAQTTEAQLTLVAVASPTPATIATATLAPTVSLADRAEFVLDVTIPDGTDLNPGVSFTKTWRLKNTGTSTWTTSYSLVFISGDKMGDTASVPLAQQVLPGESVDISVVLVAPATPGRYKGYWKMLNSAGQFFDDSIYVEIDVVGEGVATATATATGSGTSTISDLAMVVDEASYSGACPHTLNFSASFTVNKDTAITYVLEAGSDTPGFQFTLPPAQTSTFSAGTYALGFPLDFTDSVEGWVRLHITSPVDLTSNQVNFTLTCE